MPELPEVEQVRISLLPHIKGKTILKAEVRLPRMIHHPAVPDFIMGVAGRTITDVRRRGKYLTLLLDDGRYILAHLRMTGALLVTPGENREPPFARVRFSLNGGTNLWFTDIRTFGTLCLCGGSDPWQDKGYKGLGPEPLSPEFTEAYLKEKLRKSHQMVKCFILDQHKIAGIGNIYADEALSMAGIRPTRYTDNLTLRQIHALYEAVNQAIAQGLRNRGTTFRNYQDADGQMGNNKDFLLVYGRKGLPCPKCGTELKQIKVGGRGSVYCPRCQK
ncbi:MAG: bifunctional DNA-formamidopyrimidine glycosylase/DNA-(apurinic or apyrimidinic site) lyase [Acidaminococcaceae bacterium]|nr:bifunctional DNA-formamidopyrimidine glycosylase/DNA-(apurinic or apyrimidinic site) lyase [Acidaminococcaceae bacterium]MBO6038864.1 bifunctional DNA-formamidopyrimidine glycosylase/DNA-(apurinic or apyrimidinic site) lyase [Acidaminococcaceae bacterium]